MLIEFRFWEEAIRLVFENKLQDVYLPEIYDQGDATVRLLINNEQKRIMK